MLSDAVSSLVPARVAARAGASELLGSKLQKERKMYTWPLSTSQTSRLNLDSHAARCGEEDARMLEGEFDVLKHANRIVDDMLEDEECTDDPDELRARFVDSYVASFREFRQAQETDE
jgi:hypothetical protein